MNEQNKLTIAHDQIDHLKSKKIKLGKAMANPSNPPLEPDPP